jgi:hypothetical protein
MDRLRLAKDIASRDHVEFQERVTDKYRQNAWEREEKINNKIKEDHEEHFKNVPLMLRGKGAEELVADNETGALNKTSATGVGLDNKYLN